MAFNDFFSACNRNTNNMTFGHFAVADFANHFYDASLSLCRHESDYEFWWRYYLYPRSFNGPYIDDEPPIGPPVYYDWQYLVPAWPKSVLPLLGIRARIRHGHP
jgi:hypothetical protein